MVPILKKCRKMLAAFFHTPTWAGALSQLAHTLLTSPELPPCIGFALQPCYDCAVLLFIAGQVLVTAMDSCCTLVTLQSRQHLLWVEGRSPANDEFCVRIVIIQVNCETCSLGLGRI